MVCVRVREFQVNGPFAGKKRERQIYREIVRGKTKRVLCEKDRRMCLR